MKLQNEVEILAHRYVRKGGKDNRRQQVGRMLAFAGHAEQMGARSMAQVGGKHVVSYWRALRSKGGLAPRTLYGHWLALRALWRLSKKNGEPPLPSELEKQPAGKSGPPSGVTEEAARTAGESGSADH